MDVETPQQKAQRIREDEEREAAERSMSVETPEEKAARIREEEAAERAQVERLPGARMEVNTQADEKEREQMNKKLASEMASQKAFSEKAPTIREAWDQAREKQERADNAMKVESDLQRGTQPPGEPLDMRGICAQVITIGGWADIYLLRYQTPDKLMTIFSNLIKPVYRYLNTTYFNGIAQLIGLGYFRFRYDGKRGMSVEIYDTATIPSAIGSIPNKPILSTEEFFRAVNGAPSFVSLVNALIYKAFLELFVQSNLRLDAPFDYIVGLDLYDTRSRQQALLFHKDETPSIPTQFFTLTYIIEEPSIIMKGPTIVTAENMERKASITVAVKNGSTVGVDNRIVLHATPDPEVSIPTTESQLLWKERLILPTIEAPKFVLKTVRAASDYERSELAADLDLRKRQIAKIEGDTQNTQRTFLRTWYITSFPNDSGARAEPINGLTLKWDDMESLISDIEEKTCFVNRRVMPAHEFIESKLAKRMSLSGGAETIVETSPKPLQYDEPLLKKNGAPVTSNQETENEPSIADVFYSPEFRELLTSTDNFILGTIVKGNDKGAALPNGGKKVPRSKKKTMKRTKRSKTHRRIIRRKQKTQIRTKRTKTRR
jgi:hypothetical protein